VSEAPCAARLSETFFWCCLLARIGKHGHDKTYDTNPKPYTVGSTPYTLHPTPYNLHPTSYTLQPAPYILHPTTCTLHPTPYNLHPTSYTLQPEPYSQTPKGRGCRHDVHGRVGREAVSDTNTCVSVCPFIFLSWCLHACVCVCVCVFVCVCVCQGPIYYRDADGALLVYDTTDTESFAKVKNWVEPHL
jgi:hypothetical protein